jgi:hypothetical protein
MGDLVALVFEQFDRVALFLDVREILGQSNELVCRLLYNLCLTFKEIKKDGVLWYQQLLDAHALSPFYHGFSLIHNVQP